MKQLWNYILELGSIEIFLISCTLVFMFSIVLFVFLTISSRTKKIRREIYRKKNTSHINNTLFAIAFDGAGLDNFKDDPLFKRNWKRKLYKDQFLTELIKLHRLYGGEIAHNLRKCYKDFRLIQLSYSKVRSRKWELKCAGIQELGEMEIKKAVPVILEYTRSKNNTLKMVALIEVIHLSGLKGLSLLEDYKEPLNDWIQLNLLESIKEANISEVPDFGYLLESTNETIVIFGLRLLTLFRQDHHLPTVKLLQTTSSRKINMQARITFKQLTATAGEVLQNEEDRILQIPYEMYNAREENSYSPNVLYVVLFSGFLVICLALAIWLMWY
ncbi:hypothetical protein FK178_06440 [Antarcticibacterium arcticum]|uniref:Uncharacterized protein n=1 Tax=Antarcticibacterium arcticum TaxID=2585771 RepID=A0A5B8YNK6_9FLAO|nr:hypothetical protein [Antarcticibacterium arcticum]QED37379.1 hypothetical protein FK178_06440 [Antarcticibacterium arcticum]